MGTALPPRGPAQPPESHTPLFWALTCLTPAPSIFLGKRPEFLSVVDPQSFAGRVPRSSGSLPVSHAVPCGFLLYDRDRPLRFVPAEMQTGPAWRALGKSRGTRRPALALSHPQQEAPSALQVGPWGAGDPAVTQDRKAFLYLSIEE